LKKAIKRLQRSRDWIKVGNADLKDKNQLEEVRSLIEVEMHRFKGLEKEYKMKTYSKKGLAVAEK
jgi:CCR4-NOT transcription complex subunit 3